MICHECKMYHECKMKKTSYVSICIKVFLHGSVQDLLK